LIVTVVPPVFVRVTVSVAVLVAPTVVDGKLTLEGVTVTVAVEAAVGHAFTRFVTLNDPSPVVRSYPAVALYPLSMPA
jgi:hypothetical protein